MKKCRTVELKHCNELFLQFCVNYNTPERERYREIYESAEMDEREKEIESAVRAAGDSVLSALREDGLPIICASAEAPLHHDR